MIRGLNVDDQAAEDALVQLAAHLPADVEMGAPIAAREHRGNVTIITNGEDHVFVWRLTTNGDAERIRVVDDQCEVTTYRRGRELLRQILESDE